MLVPILLVTFLSISVPSPSPIVDLEKEREALLAIHASDRAAHFQTDAARLLEHSGETFVAVSDGRITRPTLGEQRQFFEEYFRGAKYSEWDDLEPPIVQVSKDGTMAWMIVRTSVRRKAPDASGVEREARFVYAGIMTYEKRAGRWVRTANVSTFEPRRLRGSRTTRSTSPAPASQTSSLLRRETIRDANGRRGRDTSPPRLACHTLDRVGDQDTEWSRPSNRPVYKSQIANHRFLGRLLPRTDADQKVWQYASPVTFRRIGRLPGTKGAEVP